MISRERMSRDFAEMAKCSDTQGEQGITRLAFSDSDWQGRAYIISQMKEGAVVNIYGMDGKVITQFTAKHAGSCRLNLSPLPKGVYIVKADNITYKIMKR